MLEPLSTTYEQVKITENYMCDVFILYTHSVVSKL